MNEAALHAILSHVSPLDDDGIPDTKVAVYPVTGESFTVLVTARILPWDGVAHRYEVLALQVVTHAEAAALGCVTARDALLAESRQL